VVGRLRAGASRRRQVERTGYQGEVPDSVSFDRSSANTRGRRTPSGRKAFDQRVQIPLCLHASLRGVSGGGPSPDSGKEYEQLLSTSRVPGGIIETLCRCTDISCVVRSFSL
jgi:hypothetical protein